jgi:branched-subunit amino acid transport protein
MPGWAYGAITILGMAAVTALSRGFFLWSKRDLRLPDALQRALQVAPLAAIVAVLAPEIFMTHGATAFYAWRPGVLGPLLAGLAVYMPLHVGLGW